MLMSQTLAYLLRSPVFWGDHEVKASSPAWCSEACLNWPRMGWGSLIITVVIISRLSICYNPNSWRTVQGNKSLFLFFPLGIIRFASSRSSEASGRRETSAELIKEPGLQEQAQPD